MLARWSCGVMCTLLVVVAVGSPATQAQTPAPGQAAATTTADYRFPTGAGLLFFYVRPEKTLEFEAITSRIGDVLATTLDATRQRQAANWRIYRSAETVREQAIYVFAFDPAIPDADYDPVKLLGEGLPDEARALYDQLTESVVRVERMGLQKIR